MITEQQKEMIEQEATSKYPIYIEEFFDNSFKEYDQYVSEQEELQAVYITTATLYQSKLNAQAELLKKAEEALADLLAWSSHIPLPGNCVVLKAKETLSLIKQGQPDKI